MPKRLAAGVGGSGRADEKRSRRRRRFLYLVMGDWAKGYSIRRVDLEEEEDYDAADTDEKQQQVERRLPPAVLRLEAPHDDGVNHFAAAFGSKIMALHDTRRRYVPVFDVRSRCLTFGPPLSRDPFAPIYVPIGSDKLFCLDYDVFEVLHQPPPPIDPYRIKIVPKWLPWRRLSWPPFNHHYVTSHAVHPDGRTIFVSAASRKRRTAGTGGTGASRKRKSKTAGAGTFTFDTAAVTDDDDLGSWTRCGEWQLPFKGRAHYDHELDAWVGLAGDDPDTLGHLCSCDVPPPPPPPTDDGEQQPPPPPPAWKLSKEKLFCNDPAEKHGGATLVHLAGGRSRSNRFCLLQRLSLDDREESVYKEDIPERDRHLLRLTTFSVRYDRNGDLTTTNHRRVRSFELPEAVAECGDFFTDPVAFWM